MVVAVIAMGMVEVAIDQVVHVIAMGYRLVAAARTVNVTGVVRLTGMIRRAVRGVLGIDGNDVFIHMVFMWVMQVTVMQVVDMIAVFHGSVTASGSVLMVVVWVDLAAHVWVSLLCGLTPVRRYLIERWPACSSAS